jgi:RNA polymerase sigma factor (sigma-70 family)
MTESTQLTNNWEYWYPRVYGYFYKRVDNKTDVEDLTANTLSTVFTANNILNINAYTWKVAHNYLVRYIDLRTKTPIAVSWDDNLEWIPQNESEDFDQVESQYSQNFTNKLSSLKECINNQLTRPEDKMLIELSIYQERNSTQIAKVLGLKPDTVRQKLSRTLKKLKKHCTSLWQEI